MPSPDSICQALSLRYGLLALGLLAAMVLSPHRAGAQSSPWSVTYTDSGSVTATNAYGTVYNVPWGTNNAGQFLTADGPNTFGEQENNGYPNMIGFTYQDQGTITPTFTWTGSGTAPSALPVILYAWAAADVSPSTNTPTANDGLGDTAVSISNPTGAISQGYHVETVNISNGVGTYPAVSLSAGDSTPASGVNVYSGANVSVTAYALTIYPKGAAQDSSGNWDILIGQKCIPSLIGIPTSCTPSNWQWSVSDPQDTFQSWTPTTTSPPAPQANANASYYSGGPGILNVQNPGGWYWDNQGVNQDFTETVTCTVTLTPPTGEGNPFTVTVSQPVNVWTPNWVSTTTGGQMYVGHFQVGGTGTNNTYSTNDFYLMAGETPPAIVPGSTPPVIEGNGISFGASVTPLTKGPTNSSGASLFGLGTFELVQLVTPKINYVDTSPMQWENIYYGQTGLDTQYPYPSYPLNFTSPPSNGFISDDAPGLDLTANNAFLASVDDSFQDDLMFTAPGSTQPVPVGYFQWSADGSAELTGSQTWAQFVGATGYVSAGTVTPSGQSQFTPQNTFPMWTLIINATTDINLPDNDMSMVKKPIDSSASL